MGSISLIDTLGKIEESGLKFLDYSVLGRLTGNYNRNSLYKMANRLEKKKILTRLTGAGKYYLTKSNPTEFEIANYLYRPSYISLESALSFYGILPQFVYSITSVTTRKSKKFLAQNKEYVFSHLNKDIFWGYKKNNNILIASPEKALIDSLYFVSKNLIDLDFLELDLSVVNRQVLLKMASSIKYKPFRNKIEELNI